MNKSAIKNFAVWARQKLISDITNKAGILGITENGIAEKLPHSTNDLHFYDIGTKNYSEISGIEIKQREALVKAIKDEETSLKNYKKAYKSVVEGVAYTWFNRLIAIRFMEVNDYLPSGIRVLSSENKAKKEPDFVTNPFDTDLIFTPFEQDKIIQYKDENKLDELFRMLLIKQCNKLNEIFPELFEKTDDYSEMLLTVSFTDTDGVIYHLVNDIEEDDFNVAKEGQVEIIGWLYQYYNTEPKNEAFAKKDKLSKEDIPAVTQLFTPDWIVRYMVENSLGRLWLEGHPNDELKSSWKYYLDEAEQNPEVNIKLAEIRKDRALIAPEDIKVIDPCMGSGHVLVYAFDVLMQIYESIGYSQRDAAKSILQNNIFGLDIDDRAYQLAYFAVMMKARQYNRRILNGEYSCRVHSIRESNNISTSVFKYFEGHLTPEEDKKARVQLSDILNTFRNAKEYGSILQVDTYDWNLLKVFLSDISYSGQLGMDAINLDEIQTELLELVDTAEILSQKYDATITNPPYMPPSKCGAKLNDFVKKYYPDSKTDMFAVFIEKCNEMLKKSGYQAMITQHAWMFLSSYERLRAKLQQFDIVNMAHLGARAFEEIAGEVVQTSSFIIRKSSSNDYVGVYSRLIDAPSQKAKEKLYLDKTNLYIARQSDFLGIPGGPIAYWVNPQIFNAFKTGKNISYYIDSFQGIITGDNNKFLRLWYEVCSNKLALGETKIENIDLRKRYWIPYNKGGEFRKWYGNQDYVVNWKNGPDDKTRGKKSFSNYYLREYVSWSYIAMGTLACRYFPTGFLWDVAGSGIFDKKGFLFYLQAFISSKVGINILNIINPTINYQVENILQLPILESNEKEIVDCIVKDNIALSKADWDSFEVSWNFKRHPLIAVIHKNRNIFKDVSNISLSECYTCWEIECEERFNKVKSNEEKLNEIFIELYGLHAEISPKIEDKEVTVRKAELKRDIKSLISFAVGCMFGRYSLDIEGLAYAGGEWDSDKYNLIIPDLDNCIAITDEEYFTDDIVGRFVNFIKIIYGERTLEENLKFIADALGNKGSTSRQVIRNYFLNDFISDHIKIYQKRPIYWMFDSGKENGFKSLIYMHRWNADTIGNIRVEYLHRMQRVYESEIIRMQETIDNSTNSREVVAAEKRKDKLTKQLKETKDYDAKIAHLALSRISIDFDDGVKVNYQKVQTSQTGEQYTILIKI